MKYRPKKDKRDKQMHRDQPISVYEKYEVERDSDILL